MELYIYVDDVAQRVEMFQDEKVSVTSTLQNYSDIGKLFTDYSQSFTIPASPTNNALINLSKPKNSAVIASARPPNNLGMEPSNPPIPNMLSFFWGASGDCVSVGPD